MLDHAQTVRRLLYHLLRRCCDCASCRSSPTSRSIQNFGGGALQARPCQRHRRCRRRWLRSARRTLAPQRSRSRRASGCDAAVGSLARSSRSPRLSSRSSHRLRPPASLETLLKIATHRRRRRRRRRYRPARLETVLESVARRRRCHPCLRMEPPRGQTTGQPLAAQVNCCLIRVMVLPGHSSGSRRKMPTVCEQPPSRRCHRHQPRP